MSLLRLLEAADRKSLLHWQQTLMDWLPDNISVKLVKSPPSKFSKESSNVFELIRNGNIMCIISVNRAKDPDSPQVNDGFSLFDVQVNHERHSMLLNSNKEQLLDFLEKIEFLRKLNNGYGSKFNISLRKDNNSRFEFLIMKKGATTDREKYGTANVVFTPNNGLTANGIMHLRNLKRLGTSTASTFEKVDSLVEKCIKWIEE